MTCLAVFFLIKPILQIIFIAGILAYILYPVYKVINRRIKNNSLSASIIIISIIMVFILLMSLLVLFIISQKGMLYYFANKALNYDFMGKPFQSIISDHELNVYIYEFLIRIASEIISSIPLFLFNFVLTIFILYYALKDGNKFVEEIKNIIPIKKTHKDSIIKKFDDTLHATIYGTILVAFIQAVVATVGFYIFGVSLPLLFGILLLITAMIPFLGTVAVWLPIGAFMLVSAYINKTSLLPGIGLILYGTFIVSMIDNILKPKIIGERTEIHAVFIMIGIVGGVILFGFVGIFIGPIMIALFKTMFDIYKKEGLKWN